MSPTIWLTRWYSTSGIPPSQTTRMMHAMWERRWWTTNVDHGNKHKYHLISSWSQSTLDHKGTWGSPTQPSDNNPSYSHREVICDLNLGKTHAHKRPNVNPRGKQFKISRFYCRRSDLPEPNRTVTCDEIRVHHYDLLTKWKSKHRGRKNEPPEEKVRQQKLADKIMLSVLCVAKNNRQQGIFPWSLEDPLVACSSETPGKNWWILHQDNVCPHTAWIIQEYLKTTNVELSLHPRTWKISLVQFLTVSSPEEVSWWLLICIKEQGNQQSPYIFPQSSSDWIRKDNQGKMELCIANEDQYFEKVLNKKTDSELNISMDKIFFSYFY